MGGMGRWASFGLRRLRDRDAKGKGWCLERAGIEGRKVAFRGGEGRVGKVVWGSSDGKGLIVRWLQRCAKNGVYGRGAGRGEKKRVYLGEEC